MFGLSEKMREKKIKFILIQIDEAHSTAWPIGLKNAPEPQKSFEERIYRANEFVNNDNPPFPVYVDGWDNIFAETFRAWPDKYYCINNKYEIIGKSKYGNQGDNDALIVEDCTVLINKLLEQ